MQPEDISQPMAELLVSKIRVIYLLLVQECYQLFLFLWSSFFKNQKVKIASSQSILLSMTDVNLLWHLFKNKKKPKCFNQILNIFLFIDGKMVFFFLTFCLIFRRFRPCLLHVFSKWSQRNKNNEKTPLTTLTSEKSN